MDGSDDYFTDDIVFDEETFAVLDHEEQKYLTQPAASRPPTKRQRTEGGWNPGPGNRSRAQDEIEDLPEISLQDDGSYGITPITSESSSHVSVNQAALTKNAVKRPSTLRYSTVIAQSIHPSRNFSVSEVQHSTHSQAPPLSQKRPNAIQQPRVSSGRGQGPMLNSRAASVTSLVSPSALSSTNAIGQSHHLQRQIEGLQQQLDKVVFISAYYLSEFLMPV